jgi:predicted GIY-YIG superfamily endonuclease
MKTYWVYILKCSDGSYYTGSTSDIEKRISEHQQGTIKGYTKNRRPVKLIFSDYFEDAYDAHKLAECKNDSHSKNYIRK